MKRGSGPESSNYPNSVMSQAQKCSTMKQRGSQGANDRNKYIYSSTSNRIEMFMGPDPSNTNHNRYATGKGTTNANHRKASSRQEKQSSKEIPAFINIFHSNSGMIGQNDHPSARSH